MIREPLLSVRELRYTYPTANSLLPVEALSRVTFDLIEGEVCSIVGKSGCGKTTLLRIIAGLLRPTTGQVLLEGNAISEPSKDVAVVFQDYSKSLIPWRTVEANIVLGLSSLRLSKTTQKRRISSYLEAVGLSASTEKYPWQLSGGMQQRVAIARSLAREPKILLLDEPFGSLDAPTRFGLEDELLRCARAFGITVLIITHDIDEAVYMSNRVLLMERNGFLDTSADENVGCAEVAIELPIPRDQIETREHLKFAEYRSLILHQLHIVSERGPVAT